MTFGGVRYIAFHTRSITQIWQIGSGSPPLPISIAGQDIGRGGSGRSEPVSPVHGSAMAAPWCDGSTSKGAAMRCLNCNRDISETAKICAHCEAPVMEEPTAEEMEAARALLEQLTPEAAAELQQVFLDSDTADEFVDRIFVGNCPKCDSENT